MAERRMFAKAIIDSDAFLDMSVTARLLYYDLSMRADDDGFVNSPKKIMRMIGASEDDLRMLAARKFIIPFENGVVVIKHWRIHNYIRKDRYSETTYLEQKELLELDENGSYRLIDGNSSTTCQPLVNQRSTNGQPTVNQRSTNGQPTVNQRLTQDRLGKDRLGKDRLGKDIDAPDKPEKPIRHKHGLYQNVLLTDEDFETLKSEFPSDWELRIERLSEYIASTGKSYKNHLATIRSWARKDASKKSEESKTGNVFLEMLEERSGMQ